MSANDGATKTYVQALAEGRQHELKTKGENMIAGALRSEPSAYSIHCVQTRPSKLPRAFVAAARKSGSRMLVSL